MGSPVFRPGKSQWLGWSASARSRTFVECASQRKGQDDRFAPEADARALGAQFGVLRSGAELRAKRDPARGRSIAGAVARSEVAVNSATRRSTRSWMRFGSTPRGAGDRARRAGRLAGDAQAAPLALLAPEPGDEPPDLPAGGRALCQPLVKQRLVEILEREPAVVQPAGQLDRHADPQPGHRGRVCGRRPSRSRTPLRRPTETSPSPPRPWSRRWETRSLRRPAESGTRRLPAPLFGRSAPRPGPSLARRGSAPLEVDVLPPKRLKLSASSPHKAPWPKARGRPRAEQRRSQRPPVAARRGHGPRARREARARAAIPGSPRPRFHRDETHRVRRRALPAGPHRGTQPSPAGTKVPRTA